MNRRQKALLIATNVAGIALVWILAAVLYSIHKTHAFSTYREFSTRGFIDTQAIEEWCELRPSEKSYSVLRRMEQIGGLNSHLSTTAILVSGVFVVNVLIVLLQRDSRKE